MVKMTAHLNSSHTIRIFGIIAGVIGILQGLPWAILATLAVCIYAKAFTLDLDNESGYMTQIWENFLDQNSNKSGYLIIGSKEFNYFTSLYIPISTIWLIISCLVLKEMIINKFNKNTHIIFILWNAITCLNILTDLVLICLLGSDFYQFNDRESNNPNIEFDKISVVYGIIISAAARGYIMILLNIAMVFFIAHYAIILKKSVDTDDDKYSSQFINAYENPTSQPWDQSIKSARNSNIEYEFTNSAFSVDDERPPFLKTASINGIFANGIDHNYHINSNYIENSGNGAERNRQGGMFEGSRHNNDDSNIYANVSQEQQRNFNNGSPQRLAKIGKQGRNTSPRPVYPPQTPYIPSPDYSPPGTQRGLKSVLRSNSKYNQ